MSGLDLSFGVVRNANGKPQYNLYTDTRSSRHDGGDIKVAKTSRFVYTERIHLALTSFFLLILYAISVYAIVKNNHWYWEFYTYWSYTIFGVYLLTVFLAVVFERTWLTVACAYMQPFAQANAIMVAVIVSIVVAHLKDIERFAESNGGTFNDDAIKILRNGDWLVHGFPVFGILFLMSNYFNMYVRLVVRVYVASLHSSWAKVLYFMYWVFGPLILVGVYSIFNSPGGEYPTDIPTDAAVIIVILFVILFELAILAFIAVRGKQSVSFRVASSYYKHRL